MIKFYHYLFFLFIFIAQQGRLKADVLPRASTGNCFYIMPLFEQLRVPGALSFEEKRAQFVKMKQQLGLGNLYLNTIKAALTRN